jgi:formate/nitrite transporter FocA (FNT family)
MAQSPPEIAQTICDSGTKKTKLAVGKMFVLALLAGAYIGFGAQLSTAVKVGLADQVGVGFANLVGGAVFSVGLMLVVIGGAELFTGNTLITISTCHKKIQYHSITKELGRCLRWKLCRLNRAGNDRIRRILCFQRSRRYGNFGFNHS